MKSFLKSVMATVVGFCLFCFMVCLCLFILGAILLGSASSGSSKDFTLKDNSVLYLDLEGVLKDRVPEANPFLDALKMNKVENIGLTNILSAIKKAKENPKIKGIYIDAGAFSAAPASLEEIHDALNDFKTSKKFIISYADDYSQGCYFISSVANKIIMNPQGSVDLHGLSVNPMFYKGTLDKLGIEMQIFKVGTYKSAVEPYFLTEMSPANRSQVNSFLGDIWGNILGQISTSRNISVDKLNQITDSLSGMLNPKLMVEANLVDTMMYRTDMKKYINTLLDKDVDTKIEYADVDDMTTVPALTKVSSKDQIAVLYAQGDITSGSRAEGIQSEYLIKQIEKLRKDENVKAVVFRVNSPGGSAYASEQIWKAITDLKATKPVVVSMGDYAASGGYYISCNASKIIAEPTTLTGSIGIFGMFPNAQGLTKTIGLSFDNVKTNTHSDFGNVTRPMTSDEKRLMQAYINKGYELFLSRCAAGRNIPKDSLNLIAQGRVWTGNQALKIGLVDGIGGIDVAIKEAASLVPSLKSYKTKNYPKQENFVEQLLNTDKESISTKMMKDYLGDDYEMLERIQELKNLKAQDRVQARLPYGFKLQ